MIRCNPSVFWGGEKLTHMTLRIKLTHMKQIFSIPQKTDGIRSDYSERIKYYFVTLQFPDRRPLRSKPALRGLL